MYLSYQPELLCLYHICTNPLSYICFGIGSEWCSRRTAPRGSSTSSYTGLPSPTRTNPRWLKVKVSLTIFRNYQGNKVIRMIFYWWWWIKVTYYTTSCVISNYKPFWKSASSDITSERVHLDLWWIDEQRLLQSTGQAGRLIYPAHI